MIGRCASMAIMPSGWYRCEYETGHWHHCPEHYYGFWRALTKEEREKFFPEGSDDQSRAASPGSTAPSTQREGT